MSIDPTPATSHVQQGDISLGPVTGPIHAVQAKPVSYFIGPDGGEVKLLPGVDNHVILVEPDGMDEKHKNSLFGLPPGHYIIRLRPGVDFSRSVVD